MISVLQLLPLEHRIFASIVLLQMANALECRSPIRSLATVGLFSNRLLLGAICAEMGARPAFIHLPPLAGALGQSPITPINWSLVIATPFVLVGAAEARKAVARRRHARSTGGRRHAGPPVGTPVGH